MSDSELRIWYLMVNQDGTPYNNCTPDKVVISSSADVSDFRDAVKARNNEDLLKEKSVASLRVYKNLDDLTKQERLEEDLLLVDLVGSKMERKDALFVLVPQLNVVGASSDSQTFSLENPRFFHGTKSDEKFIIDNCLNMESYDGIKTFIEYLLERSLNGWENLPDPHHIQFERTCLEFKLEDRLTEFQVSEGDQDEGVQVVLAVSGAGKTRMLLEILHQKFGYFFVCRTTQVSQGSSDLESCSMFCEMDSQSQEDVENYLLLLYLVRATICQILMDRGYTQPWQLLYAQLHPDKLFGQDMFDVIYRNMVDCRYGWKMKPQKYFNFTVFDEIQITLKGDSKFKLNHSSKWRPFFSPLIYYTRKLNYFPKFLVSGTGFNFELLKEMMDSSSLKLGTKLGWKLVGNFHCLSKEQIELFSRKYLTYHNVTAVDSVVNGILAFTLCHGRARFLASMLDLYLIERNLDIVINEFQDRVMDVQDVWFPLRFYKEEITMKKDYMDNSLPNSFSEVVANGMINYIIQGQAVLNLQGEDAAKAVRYGLGFTSVAHQSVNSVKIEEELIVLCLRKLVPFSLVIPRLKLRMLEASHPQTLGFLLECMTAFALYMNVQSDSGNCQPDRIKVFQNPSLELYLQQSDSSFVYFPDTHCGPDIIFKSTEKKEVYFVQTKFWKKIPASERLKACQTTDPSRFYLKRNCNEIINGCEKKRELVMKQLLVLQRLDYALRQVVLFHTSGKQPKRIPGVQVITKETNPEFFNCIDKSMWNTLDLLRERFDSKWSDNEIEDLEEED